MELKIGTDLVYSILCDMTVEEGWGMESSYLTDRKCDKFLILTHFDSFVRLSSSPVARTSPKPLHKHHRPLWEDWWRVSALRSTKRSSKTPKISDPESKISDPESFLVVWHKSWLLLNTGAVPGSSPWLWDHKRLDTARQVRRASLTTLEHRKQNVKSTNFWSVNK